MVKNKIYLLYKVKFSVLIMFQKEKETMFQKK